MAKNFPYFKFIATEWLTGNIVFEDFNVQGLFINICALYWQRNGTLSVEDINMRYKNPNELPKLTDRFFSVKDGFISIQFLDEQLIDAHHISKTNSENGKLGGRPKATAKRNKANESKEKKNKRKEELKEIPALTEFLDFCKTIEGINYDNLKFSLTAKYESWVPDWKDGNGQPIKNWKAKIKNVIPHLKPMDGTKTGANEKRPVIIASKDERP